MIGMGICVRNKGPIIWLFMPVLRHWVARVMNVSESVYIEYGL